MSENENAGYSENKLIYLPDNFEDIVKLVGKAIIVKKTMAYCQQKSKHGIILMEREHDPMEKKYDVGEVVAIGPEVQIVKLGDIVIYQMSTRFRLPHAADEGISNPSYGKIEETTTHIMCILPKPEPKVEEENTVA